MNKQKQRTILFLGLLLLAGLCYSLTRTGQPLVDSLMNSASNFIYISLLLFWQSSVRTRLLTSKTRKDILLTAWLMVSYLLIRTVKYVIVSGALLQRYTVYAYWTPQMLIPALFLMTCIRIRRGGKLGRKTAALLLIPAILLALAAWTNDLHHLVYKAKLPTALFEVETGTYSYGPAFWLMYVWMAAASLSGLVLLLRETGRKAPQVLRTLVCIILLWLGLVLVNLLITSRPGSVKMFNIPEIHIFCMLGFIEVCIRGRLIPYNENYPEFFRRLRIPAVITDLELRPVFQTAVLPETGETALRTILAEPLAITPDRTLNSRQVRGGYVFWETDESAVHRAQERLSEANEWIQQENDLIRAETEQREKEAYLQSRHRIYHEIARELYPCQKRISELLRDAEPGSPEFRSSVALVSVLNAYVKRKTNLLLLGSERERLKAEELCLALRESAAYLTLAGLRSSVAEPEEVELPVSHVLALYDAFEILAEQLLGHAASMMVSWEQDGLRLAADTELLPQTDGVSLPVRFRQQENILYMDLCVPKGGKAE